MALPPSYKMKRTTAEMEARGEQFARQLAVGDAVILAANDSNGSGVSV